VPLAHGSGHYGVEGAVRKTRSSTMPSPLSGAEAAPSSP
jgi:hypothetical protein